MPSPHKPIILAGSGRSGTTWLGNILTANPNMRVLFEPFDARRVPQAKVLPLRPYARADGDYPTWSHYMSRVLAGELENEWVNRQGRRRWTNRRLIKAIRINLLLSWISEHFPVHIVYMTRHPCAVVLSRMRLEWETHLDVFLSQPELVADHLHPYLEVIDGARTAVERHTVMWCIENHIPLRQRRHYPWVFCTYEQLYRNAPAEASRILRAVQVRKTWLNLRAIAKISMVARADSAVVGQRDPLTEWQRQLSVPDIDKILGILDQFGISLYGEAADPKLSGENL